MNRIILALLLLAVAALSWMNYASYQQQLRSERQIAMLEKSLADTQQQLVKVQEKLVELDKTSVKGLVKEANGAILDGWEALVNSVENEVRKAREAMEEAYKEPPQQPQSEGDQTLESPDGTDRI